MKYGILGGFIKLAFAKTAFAYVEKALPELDMVSYRKRVLKEYRAIVERTPGVGRMKDNMFVMTMYCGAFAIALCKEAEGRMDGEMLKGLIRALADHQKWSAFYAGISAESGKTGKRRSLASGLRRLFFRSGQGIDPVRGRQAGSPKHRIGNRRLVNTRKESGRPTTSVCFFCAAHDKKNQAAMSE